MFYNEEHHFYIELGVCYGKKESAFQESAAQHAHPADHYGCDRRNDRPGHGLVAGCTLNRNANRLYPCLSPF
jgi:hypothetical protein